MNNRFPAIRFKKYAIKNLVTGKTVFRWAKDRQEAEWIKVVESRYARANSEDYIAISVQIKKR